jgi:hypothetical protein
VASVSLATLLALQVTPPLAAKELATAVTAHWAGDIALGAAIGAFGGLKVVRYSHHHPDNFIDRIMLPMRVVPSAQGASILWTIPIGREGALKADCASGAQSPSGVPVGRLGYRGALCTETYQVVAG